METVSDAIRIKKYQKRKQAEIAFFLLLFVIIEYSVFADKYTDGCY